MVIIEKVAQDFERKSLMQERQLTVYEEDNMTLVQFSQARGVSVVVPNSVSTEVFYQAESSSRQMKLSEEHYKAKKCATERAEEVKANLDPQFPSFVKSMLHSHVTRGFWLGLPAKFCNSHLPKQDSPMTLVDENQKEYATKFLVEKIGLSAGWRGFSISHHLVEGDALVFQLVEDTKFQVYIIRAYSLGAINGVTGIRTCQSKRKTSERAASGKQKINERTAKKCRKMIQLNALAVQESKEVKSRTTGRIDKYKKNGRSSRKGRHRFQLNSLQPSKEDQYSRTNSEEVGSEVVLQGVKDMENVECTTISVNGVIIEPEISMEVKRKYRELCLSRGSFLHNNLVPGLTTKFVAGAISETVEIAESIKAAKLSTFQKEFPTWETRLRALQIIGIDVEFLCDRLHRLKDIAVSSEADSKEYAEAQAQQSQVEMEIQMLKEKLVESEKRWEIFDSKTETLEAKTRTHEQRFHLEARFPS